MLSERGLVVRTNRPNLLKGRFDRLRSKHLHIYHNLQFRIMPNNEVWVYKKGTLNGPKV